MSKINLNKLLGKPFSEDQKFHDKTKISKPSKGLDPKDWPKEWTKVYTKHYLRLDKIILPEPSLSGGISLKDAFKNRTSIREFSSMPLNLEEISSLLYYSGGRVVPDSNSRPKRFYPSAGARYPLEIYIVSINSDLSRGIYHYNVNSHSLEVLCKMDSINFRVFSASSWVKKASCIVLISAYFERTTMKYGTRGYRHILTEVGELVQNLYLICSALNIGCCGVGDYMDDKLNELLDIDGVQESVVFALPLGIRK